MIRVADQVVDLGLGAGEQGGRVIYSGPVAGPARGSAVADRALPARRAGDSRAADAPAARRRSACAIRGRDRAQPEEHRRRHSARLLTCVTGVSGSGKSTLVHDVIYAAVKRAKGDWDRRVGDHRSLEGAEFITDVVLVDQQPIGRTPRSNPVTYLKAFDPIRELFAATKDARTRGLTASHFSFNVPGGRCEACEGEGVVRVEMQFLADVFVPCDQCDGKRFRPHVLEVRYKGRNIDQVLDLTVREALAFFAGAPKVLRRLQVLDEIGLGYLRLGQPATTLSGGEAQRIKIASHLGSNTVMLCVPTRSFSYCCELDRYIVGQDEAKRAVAIAIRNRWRRQQLSEEMRKEVTPKNIIMIGPTGVGKTEIARRMATLLKAPFCKVEATKYTEVGYHGRDVESVVRDLVEASFRLVKDQERERVRQDAEQRERSAC